MSQLLQLGLEYLSPKYANSTFLRQHRPVACRSGNVLDGELRRSSSLRRGLPACELRRDGPQYTQAQVCSLAIPKPEVTPKWPRLDPEVRVSPQTKVGR